MPDNVTRTKGRGSGYKFDRGGMPAEFGPFIGVVKNNIDPTRGGRLQVYIRQFSGGDETDESLWRTVSYIPPFYGSTPHTGTNQGAGTFVGNQQSYGFWMTPPDLGVQVICFFVEGDPNQGYYLGVVPDPGINHMVPAIGASTRYALSNQGQENFLAGARQLPVTEINSDNVAIAQSPRFFDEPKPVHSVVAGIMFQQGLINDPVRGPITSNSQRETPSAVFGFSTPGKAIYQGGLSEVDIKGRLEQGQIRPQDVEVIGRRGGHSIVLDDGNLEGRDTLVRIRTAKGHQITMSDDGDCFYITHANGQTWIELGKQGTVDVFSTNSVNIRTQGTINLHADRDINMYAGGSINAKSKVMKLQASASMDIMSESAMSIYSKGRIGVRTDGTLALKSVSQGGWDAGGSLRLKAGCIDLNGGGSPPPVNPPQLFKDFRLADTVFVPQQGWQSKPGTLPTIVTRAPTHEPYPYHNQGTANITALGPAPSASLTGAAANTLSKIAGVLPEGTIDVAAFSLQNPATIAVGSLQPSQVTGLLAQAAAVSGQSFTDITSGGIGKFAVSPEQLESAGLLKPGTVQNFLQDSSNLTQVLSSPSVWTGRSGVSGLAGFLGSPNVQDQVQQEVMLSALSGLQSAGVVTGTETPAELAPFVQAASKFGVNQAVAWVKGVASPDVAASISAVAKGAQYAVNFVDEKLPTSLGTGQQIGGFVDTVRRGSVDSALAQIIDNPKIPTPNFGSGLFSSSSNEDLVYNGDDSIVWDRINNERLRRGLPGLAALGLPRPA